MSAQVRPRAGLIASCDELDIEAVTYMCVYSVQVENDWENMKI